MSYEHHGSPSLTRRATMGFSKEIRQSATSKTCALGSSVGWALGRFPGLNNWAMWPYDPSNLFAAGQNDRIPAFIQNGKRDVRIVSERNLRFSSRGQSAWLAAVGDERSPRDRGASAALKGELRWV